MWLKLEIDSCSIQKVEYFHLLFKVKRITADSTNPSFILATLWTCFFSPFSSFIMKNIGTSPLTRKQVKPEDSFVADHSLLCSHSASYDDFSILTRQNKKFLLESKESLLIMRDKPSLDKNITSAPLHFFDRA